jgi:HEAT repeat protein
MWPFGPPNVARLDAKGNVESLVRAAGYKKDPAVREAARLALEKRLDWLVSTLDSRNIRHVVTCRAALKLVGEPAVTKLVDVLEKGDTGRRRDAAFGLGEVGLPSGVPALKVALRDDDETVRVLAVKALGRIDDERVPALIEKALRDCDDAVRYHASAELKKLRKRARKRGTAAPDAEKQGGGAGHRRRPTPPP